MQRYFSLKKKYNIKQEHPYHLVTPSPWPLLTSIGLTQSAIGLTMYMHRLESGVFTLTMGILFVTLVVSCWFRDIIRESTYEGRHTTIVQNSLARGFSLFIISEIMLFFSFFWALIYFMTSPTIQIGCTWPPEGINAIPFEGIVIFNTYILLYSGVTITATHYTLRLGHHFNTTIMFIVTLIAAFLFLGFQAVEYRNAPFCISDGIYPSLFFLLTGFHGFHVLAGTIFILICFVRHLFNHFTRERHLGFECAIWYWHFVDIIWILLVILLYLPVGSSYIANILDFYYILSALFYEFIEFLQTVSQTSF